MPVSPARRRLVLSSAALAALARIAPGALAQPAAERWAAAWCAAPLDFRTLPVAPDLPPAALVLKDQTVRMRLPVHLAGPRLRIRFSNRFGTAPLEIGAASVARSTGEDAVSPVGLKPLRFDGRARASIPPGAELWSDPVALPLRAGQWLGVSFHLPQATPLGTGHTPMGNPAWLVPGNAVMTPKLQAPSRAVWNPVLTGVDVMARANVVVAFGDSITQGVGARDGELRSYPGRLAQRLYDAPGMPVSVVNAGIAGNRLLADSTGPSGLSRFERDVLEQSGVTHAIVLIGINDIGYPAITAGLMPSPPVEAAQIAAGLQQLLALARARGVKLLPATLPPFKGAPYWTAENEARRQLLNRWIRGLQGVDAVIDFDAALRSRTDWLVLDEPYDSGDHLHPSDAGYAAMADYVSLDELRE